MIFISPGVADLIKEKMEPQPEVHTAQEQVDNLNRFLRHSWQQSRAEIKHFNPPRMENGAPKGSVPEECEPMERFVFMHDCFTSLDGEIVEGGVKIIYNAHKEKYYPEDKAFWKFEPGQVVTWEQLLESVKAFVFIINDRLHNWKKYHEDPKLLESQKDKTYKTLMLEDLTQPQRSQLAYRLDHNTCCGYLTACAVARGDHGNVSVKEIFEKYGDRSSRSAAILAGKVLKYRWFS